MQADLPETLIALGMPGTRTMYYRGNGSRDDVAAVAMQVERMTPAIMRGLGFLSVSREVATALLDRFAREHPRA